MVRYPLREISYTQGASRHPSEATVNAMSATYSVYCEDCLESLWVGQGSKASPAFYTGHPEVMEALGRFLWQHEDHELRFASCYWPDACGKEYTEFEDVAPGP